MYGILAACIAVMAMFLGLFALSVDTTDTVHAKHAKAPVETARTPAKTLASR